MDEFVRLWQELDETDKHLYIRKGEVLTKAKESIIHGEWEEFLQIIDVKKRTAQRHMRIYRVSIKTPALTLLNLSGTKLDQLGRLEDKQLEMFLEEHGGELENTSLRELTKMINAILKPEKANNTDTNFVTVKISIHREYYEYMEQLRQKFITECEYGCTPEKLEAEKLICPYVTIEEMLSDELSKLIKYYMR
ncbi:MAG: DUF3102 domain-containing protein [Parasporobacterium sp.]|nr:DUF3102 domain-containing protein [Parasporobacterium sp.]